MYHRFSDIYITYIFYNIICVCILYIVCKIVLLRCLWSHWFGREPMKDRIHFLHCNIGSTPSAFIRFVVHRSNILNKLIKTRSKFIIIDV